MEQMVLAKLKNTDRSILITLCKTQTPRTKDLEYNEVVREKVGCTLELTDIGKYFPNTISKGTKINNQ